MQLNRPSLIIHGILILIYSVLCLISPLAAAIADPLDIIDYQPVDDLLFEIGNSGVKAIFYSDLIPGEMEHRLLRSVEPVMDIFDLKGRHLRSVSLDIPDGRQPRSNALKLPDEKIALVARRSHSLIILDNEGQRLKEIQIRGKITPGRRVTEFDAKVYQFATVSVYLDFARKTVAWETGNRMQRLRYEDLRPHCRVVLTAGRLHLLDPDHRLIVDLQEPSTRFTGEVVFANPAGERWTVDRQREQALRYAPDGELVSFFGPIGKQGPFCIDAAALPDGRIAVLDGRDSRIYIYEPDGTRKAVFGRSGKEPGALLAPRGIIADTDDRLIVRDPAGERATVFSTDGRFIAEWRDIIIGDRPDSLRVYVDTQQNIHLVDWDGKRHFSHPANTNLLTELDRLFDSDARYPRSYMTITADGHLLCFDTARNRYERLRGNGQVQGVDVTESLARVYPVAEPEINQLGRLGEQLLLLDEEGRLLILNRDDGSTRLIPMKIPVSRLIYSEGSTCQIINQQGYRLLLDSRGNILPGGRDVYRDELLAGDGNLFFQATDTKVFLATEDKKQRLLVDLGDRQVLSIVPQLGYLHVYYRRGEVLGVMRCRRKDVYREALQYYNHSMFRMAAVRFERMIERDLDGPAVRWHLIRCYRQLQRDDLAEQSTAILIDRWPESPETVRLKEGNTR